MMITGKELIEWGFKPGKWFKAAIEESNKMRNAGASNDEIFQHLQTLVPVEINLRTNGKPFSVFLEAENELEQDNLEAVSRHMDALMRVPTIKTGVVMPDACPSGIQPGTIPVGGAVATEDAIHPGFHSADICCSVAITVFKRDDDPKKLLDAMESVTHFGPGGRDKMLEIKELSNLIKGMDENRFLKGLENFAQGHFGSQGDGNHFAYVGNIKSTGELALVTHHGSRGLGAQLYKRGMAVAKKHTTIIAPRIPAHNAWIKASSQDGEEYWKALQIIRTWTKLNHFALHDLAAKRIGNQIADRFWNEHNFVFQKSDGLFYHGKGATPSWEGFSPDDDGLTMIPLNMSEPILITRHANNEKALGFAPHGAGRNMGRKAFLREHGEPELPPGIDLRSYCGKVDYSELPQAYKNAKAVRDQIEKFNLATVVDEVLPYGCIMAGDWEHNAPWRNK